MAVLTSTKPLLAHVVETLVERKLLKPAEAKFLLGKYSLPTELAQVLLTKKIVTQEELAKVFAVAMNLPFVRLVGKQIPAATLLRVPEDVARKRLILAFEETPTQIKLAVGEPYRLGQATVGPLHRLAQSIGKKVELAIVPRQDIESIFVQYSTPSKITEGSIPTINLENVTIAPDVLKKFPEEIAKKYNMAVFEALSDNHIKVAAVTPNDPKVRDILDFLKSRNNIKIDLYQTAQKGLDYALAGYQGFKPREEIPPAPVPPVQPVSRPIETPNGGVAAPVVATPTIEETNIDQLLGKPIINKTQFEAELKSGFIPRVVGAILSFAANSRASDIHLEPAKEDLRLRFRIDGQLEEVARLPIGLHPPLVSRIKILSQMKIDERRIPQDGRFDVTVSKHDIDLRVSTLPTVFGEKIVLRLLDKSAIKLTLEQIGLTGNNLKSVEQEIDKPWGIVLTTGPTGSGKTTTLYAMLQKLVKANVNIITLEDPVEYEISGVNQSQVKPKIGFSFAEGLRSVLRQDPNIIMVGEIRDRETAELATQAALTGHLVLSTLHTNDAASSLSRLINIGVEPFLITSAMNAVISQRLVRRLCDKCKRQVNVPDVMIKEIGELMTGVPGFSLSAAKFFGPVGCKECTDGYKGRIGIFEVMAMSDRIEQASLAKQAASEIEKIAKLEGMTTMRQDGVVKAAKGITSLDEVWKSTAQ